MHSVTSRQSPRFPPVRYAILSQRIRMQASVALPGVCIPSLTRGSPEPAATSLEGIRVSDPLGSRVNETGPGVAVESPAQWSGRV
ncbi:hypothetical protein FRC09_011014 [Ceratobasidium sp. 395]|nr:hypothetical protein FRC09_011014 [Ceratobasidium sp. 395]